ncbi:hypothetical protein [Bordetella sp. 02P26C-1]|uniref:hypothetical protein n=1 Tax=Bordetella sp. 02P26C-1 TaxID=2683195 RepID=UPI001354257D|nr:hypothetical protein [Bordetella sp. 02P26C-1]MVW80691.1 hypothetical protein [Bordetella sp. 02P26C-1]
MRRITWNAPFSRRRSLVFYTVVIICVALMNWLLYEAIVAIRYDDPIDIGDRTCRFPRGFDAKWVVEPTTLSLTVPDLLPAAEHGSQDATNVRVFHAGNPESMRSRVMATRLSRAAQTATATRMVGTTSEGFAIYVCELQRHPLRVDRSYVKRDANGLSVLIDDPDINSERLRVLRQVSAELEVDYEMPRSLLAQFAQTDARVMKLMNRHCSARRR